MKWISVKERLPEEEKAYFIYSYKLGKLFTFIIHTDAIYKDFKWVKNLKCPCDKHLCHLQCSDEYCKKEIEIEDVTHWAEIEPPKDEE